MFYFLHDSTPLRMIPYRNSLFSHFYFRENLDYLSVLRNTKLSFIALSVRSNADAGVLNDLQLSDALALSERNGRRLNCFKHFNLKPATVKTILYL